MHDGRQQRTAPLVIHFFTSVTVLEHVIECAIFMSQFSPKPRVVIFYQLKKQFDFTGTCRLTALTITGCPTHAGQRQDKISTVVLFENNALSIVLSSIFSTSALWFACLFYFNDFRKPKLHI